MFEQFVKRSNIVHRLQQSKFKLVLNQCASYLIENGYSKCSINGYRRSIEHFLRWLEQENFNPQINIDKSLILKFLNHHIPECKCPLPAPRSPNILLRGLNLLLQLQTSKSPIDSGIQQSSEIDDMVKEFDDHLINICGFTFKTRITYCYYVRLFLNNYLDSGHIFINNLTQNNVRHFLYLHSQHYKNKAFHVFVCSLYCFFKFLRFKGIIDDLLLKSMPKVIGWKSTVLPEYLNKDEIIKLLNVFDRTTSSGKRDYAIAICIIELGLRAGEVASLRLDDINWHDKTLSLSHSKSRQPSLFPMTVLVIKSLIDYLKYGRPKTSSRQVFLCNNAPIGKSISSSTVSKLIRRACIRAELSPKSTGAHLLRRTFATRLLQNGATIKEIADVLRHRSINTTTIYTQVNFSCLHQVALPWPEKLS